MNKFIGIGNLTKDVELSTTTSGVSVGKFTLAIGRRFTNAEGERETDFLNVVVWREQAENCAKYLKKGSKCAVVGEVQTRSYDGNDGTKKYVTEIRAEQVEFLSTKQGEAKEESGQAKQPEMQPIDDNDLPF